MTFTRTQTILFACLITFLYNPSANAQKWKEIMSTGKGSFYEAQADFEQYWEGRTIEKGKGYKQFKRWEYFMEPRVDKTTGLLPDKGILWTEYVRMQAGNSSGASRAAAPPGGSWSLVGPSTVPANGGAGRVNCVTFDPANNNNVWIGAPDGGVWKSTNAGATWTTNTDALTNLGVSDIAITPGNSSIMYLATGDRDGGDTYSYGVLKSTDGGANWAATSLVFTVSTAERANRIIIDPSTPATVIVGTTDGIYRSTNSGGTWTSVSVSRNFTSLAFHPTNSSIVYAGSRDPWTHDSRIYKSTNNGVSWTHITSGLPSSGNVGRWELAVSPAAVNTVWALGSDTDDGFYGLYKSTNSGVNWSLVDNSPNLMGWSETGSDIGGQGYYDIALAVDRVDANIIYVGGVNIWKSTNGGTTWSLAGHWYGGGGADYIHADQHAFTQRSNGDLWVGNDGGVYFTNDGGNSWTDRSNGLAIHQYYRLGTSATDDDLTLGGSQDNGTDRANGGVFTRVIGGDGMEAIIDYSNANIMYGSLYYGDIRKSTNGGGSFNSLNMDGMGYSGAWVTPYVMHPTTPTTLYAGYQDVIRSTNGGTSWTDLSTNLTSGIDLRSLKVAKSNPAYIYAATYDDIWRTSNSGGAWTNVSSGLPAQSITYIEVNPTNPSEVWVTLSGYSNNTKVYRSINAGASWTNFSGTALPNVPANCILYEEGSADALYVGTDLGVYYRDNSMTDWAPLNSGLPNVIVKELEIQYSSNTLRAATYGRGLWEMDLGATGAPVADFSASATVLCTGDVITYTDNSSGSPATWNWVFQGGTPSTHTGATPPAITYNTAGNFYTRLITSNAIGADTMLIANYISVVNSSTIIPRTLGTATNIWSGYYNHPNQLIVNNDINSVLYIHRQNTNLFTGISGHLRYDLSTDNGDNWTLNLGILNPTAADGVDPARYPQISVHNPTANTNPNNAYLVYHAPYTVAGWDGYVSGVRKLDGTGNTQNTDQAGAINTDVPGSLVQGAPGKFWTTDDINDGFGRMGFRIMEGTWNGSNDVNWTINSNYTTGFNTAFNGDVQIYQHAIAFDPTGNIGWVALCADMTAGLSQYVSEPVFYKTINGGATWTGPTVVSLGGFPSVASRVPVGQFPSTGFEMDLVVDANGNPHLFTNISSGSGTDYSINEDQMNSIFDIHHNGTAWTAILLADVETFRNTFTTGSLTHDNRPQASRSDNGLIVTVCWVESDDALTFGTDNTLPNLVERTYNVTANTWTPERHHTICSNLNAEMLLTTVSPKLLQVGSDYKLPIVFTQANVSDSDLDPPSYYYFAPNVHSTVGCFTPTALFTISGQCAGTPTDFFDFSSDVSGGATYKWDIDNNGIIDYTTKGDISHTYATAGTYTAVLTVTNAVGCVDSYSFNISIGATSVITPKTLGTASNVFTTFANRTNQVIVDNDINTVIFVHRQNTSLFAGNTGHFRYDISTNNGSTWSLNQGILNPTGADGFDAGRYPNVAIYNPAANTIANNAYLSYYGATADAAFNGYVSGVRRLNGTGNTENYNQATGTNTLYAGSLVKGATDEFWAVDRINDGSADLGFRVLKGTWNGSNDITWAVNTTFTTGFNTSLTGDRWIADAAIGFDPTGTNGWVAAISHMTAGPATYQYHPVFYQTTNGGATWSGPISVDLGSFSNITSMVPGGLLPAAAFDMDLAVDANGYPHLLVNVSAGDGTGYSIYPGSLNAMFDITYNGAVWRASHLADLGTFRNTFGLTPLVHDNRPQMSRSADGLVINASWCDSDPNATGGIENTEPNFVETTLDVGSGTWGAVNNHTLCSNLGGQILLPTVSPILLQIGTDYKVPMVYGELNVSGDDTDPTQFYYYDPIVFSNAPCTPPVASFTTSGLCEDGFTLFTNGTTGGGTSPTYQWDIDNNGSVEYTFAGNISHVFDSPGSHDVLLRVIKSPGCVDTYLATVNINAKPANTLSDQGGCAGNSVTFNAGVWNGYAWTTGGSTQTENATVGSADSIGVAVQDGNGCWSDTAYAKILVVPSPQAFFTVGDTCDGSAAAFGDLSTGITGGTTYAWDINNDASTDYTTVGDITHNYPGPGTYTAKLLVSDGPGCETAYQTTVVILDKPTGTMDDEANCLGEQVTFDAGSWFGYSWSIGGTTQLKTVTVVGPALISVEVKDANGCWSDPIFANITVNPLPVAGFTAANFCAGSPTVFTDISTGVNGTSVYSWDIDNDASVDYVNNGGLSHTYAIAGNYTVMLEVSNGNNCEDTHSSMITINALPVSNIPDTSACEGETIALNAGVWSAYNWSTGGTAQIELILVNGTQAVNLQVQSGAGCWSQVSSAVITEIPNPVANFGFSNVGMTFTFNNTSANGNTYQWSFGDGNYSSVQSPVHVYTAPGTYTVELTTSNDCGDAVISKVIIVIGTDIAESDGLSRFAVYPNPFTDEFNLDFSLDKNTPVRIEILNAIGELIHVVADNNLNAGDHLLKVYPAQANMSQGIYFVKVMMENAVHMARIVDLK